MNKSLLPAVLAAFVLAAATVAPPASADSQTIDGVEWSYTVDGANATVTGANPAEGNLVIPDTLGGATVTRIMSWAISGKDNLTDVTVPVGVVEIGSYAFNECTNLAAVHIAASVAQINYGAFDGCPNLAAVHISNLAAWCGIDFWNSSANPLSSAHRLYLDGAELTELSIPDGVASIEDFAFYGWGGVRAVIPDSVTEIGESAFESCPSLTSVAIGAGVTNVESYAFGDCPQLAAITVAPENAAYAGEGGVLFDKAGTRLVCCPAGKTGAYAVPAGVTDLVGGAFDGCAGLTSVTLPDGLLDIGYNAFWGCSGLTELAIPGSVTNIGNYAFDGCTGLAALVIPDSVTFIGSGVFYGCTGLAALEVPAAWYGTAKLANASVPKGCVVTYRGISPLAVATETLPKGRPGRAYEAKLEATGGVEPYAWGPSVVYTESAAANSFAETGTAQGWQGDDACWDLALPFEFPFFGNSYTNAKINSNGAISFGTDEFRAWAYREDTFKASPIVAVLWNEMATTRGDVYVDSGSDAVTVRWQGRRSGDPMNFSATLCRDGRIVLSYGAGNAYGGGIGISAGDGTTCQLSAKHMGGSMENAEDIVFGPSWLTVAADGTLGGIPTEAGTLALAVTVTDGAGVTASKELSLEVALPAPVEGVFARLAGTDELEAGEYVITGTKGGGREHYAMADELGGTGTTYIRRYGDSAVAVEGEEEISDPPESIVWTLEEGAQGWTIRNAEAGYVAFKGSGNSATFTAAAGSNACWTVMAGGAEGLFSVENAAKPERVLQYNGTSGQERFACYTNWGSRTQGLAFWKKGGAAKHAIEIDPNIEHGTVTTDPAGSAKPGKMVEVTATPDTDGDWQLTDVSVTYPTGETYSWSDTPFFFEMPDGDVFVTAVFSEGGVPPPEEAFVFGGDETGTVGGVVRFTVEPKEEGAEFFLADFSVPEGSALGRADVATDYPEVRFTPDKAGGYCFVFEVADEGGFGARCIEVTGGDDPGPVGELRITKVEVRDGTVTLGYVGEAKSVEGTDDLTASNSWRTVSGAAIDATNKTATLPAGKHFLRLSTEEGGGEAEHRGVQLWEGGPFWAETNIGAEKPEDAGLYFWWGDTVGYRREGDAWGASDGSAENFSFSSGNTPTYGMNNATLQSEGWITAEGALAPEHDAAQVHWGGGWRMPTDSEFAELIANTTTTWTTSNGVYGRLVTGKGDYASASIFLPAAGYGYGAGLYDSGSYGGYWSSTPYSSHSDYAWYLNFGSGDFDRYDYYRIFGFSVRALRGFAE